MKIVLWIGNAGNQKVLAGRIHAIHNVDAIFFERKKKSKSSVSDILFSKLPARLLFPSIAGAWEDLMDFYKRRSPALEGIKQYHVENINQEETYAKTLELAPDLIIVSGTSIIKHKLLSLQPKFGILNLHTGVSPYLKGGPNCTNWCLSTGQFHLIGNTIMWLNAGVDSGDIVVSRLSEFSGTESLAELHIKVMEDAHALYLYAIEKILSGHHSGTPQNSIAKGATYYTKDWTLKQRFLLMRHFKTFGAAVRSEEYRLKKASVKTIDFKDNS